MYLAIDTATSILSLVLIDNEGVKGQLQWRTDRNHTAELIPGIQYLLCKAGITLHDVEGFIVARGPGGFSGLRVGITTAKGFALSTKCPLVGIGTLDAAAFQYVGLGYPVCSILDVGKDDIAAASYGWKNSFMEKIIPEHLTTIDDLTSKTIESTLFCGEITQELKIKLKDTLGPKAIIAPVGSQPARAFSLATLGIQKINKGELDEPGSLTPLYIRHPSITKPKHSRKSI